MVQARPKVVIVGAGFGGLEAAKSLDRAAVDVTVIDRQNHHCFQPLLYQVATAALSPADVAWPIRHILRKQKNATVLMAEVRGIDTDKRVVHADSVSIPYDYLVLATGATHSYFGHDEWAEVAPGLKRIEDATRIRRRILIAFERAELATDEAERRRLLTFAIVGGGATGVEMAGAISEVARQSLAKDFRRIDPTAARIVLIEAGPRIMPTLPENLSDYVRRTLGQEGRRGDDVDAGHGVRCARGRARAWAARCRHRHLGRRRRGVARGALARCRARSRRTGAGERRICRFRAIRRCSRSATPRSLRTSRASPARRRRPSRWAAYVGRLIAARVAGRPSPPPFRYRHLGDLATIGRHAAVVKLGRLELTGFLGWLFWSLVHIYFLIGVRDRFIVAFTWLWDYVTFQRGARLITEVPPADGAEASRADLSDQLPLNQL